MRNPPWLAGDSVPGTRYGDPLLVQCAKTSEVTRDTTGKCGLMRFERRPRSNWKQSVGLKINMATNKGNSIMPSGANSLFDCHTSNSKYSGTFQSQKKSSSWADRSEEGLTTNKKSSDMEVDNTVCDVVKSCKAVERFFVVKRQEGSFDQTSPFLIHKSIQSLIGEPKAIKKLRSGELLVEVFSTKQAENLKKCTKFANIPISVSSHRTLNSSRGVISEPDLLHVTEAEILENLQEQNVTEVRRIKIYRRDEKIPANQVQLPTKHIILTFNTPSLPKSIKAGYLSCSVRPYIPNPLRCFRCQRFGHSKTSCRGNITCGRCGVLGHESLNCKEQVCCVNCKKEHPSYSKSCEQWKKEKEIQTIRTKENISYPEARKLVESRTPKAGVSYAAAISKTPHKTYKTISTQTETTIERYNQPQLRDKIPINPAQILNSMHSASSKSTQATPLVKSQIVVPNSPKPNFPKSPSFSRNSQSTSKAKSSKLTRKADAEKYNKPKIKPVSLENPSKKKKNEISKNTLNQKPTGKTSEQNILSDVDADNRCLTPDPDSDICNCDEDSMSTISD